MTPSRSRLEAEATELLGRAGAIRILGHANEMGARQTREGVLRTWTKVHGRPPLPEEELAAIVRALRTELLDELPLPAPLEDRVLDEAAVRLLEECVGAEVGLASPADIARLQERLRAPLDVEPEALPQLLGNTLSAILALAKASTPRPSRTVLVARLLLAAAGILPADVARLPSSGGGRA